MRYSIVNLLTSFMVANVAACPATAADAGYTVNGSPVAPEMAMLLAHYGFESGAYYIDANGNYGRVGAPPSGNFNGGPARGWSGAEPTDIAGNPYAQAYVNGVTGARIFWVYSPSIFSDVKGGSSGYVHICPGNVYYTSSEGAISMGGRYEGKEASGAGDPGMIDPWVGVAGQSANTGRWAIEESAQGPVLAGYGASGGAQRVPIATMLQGSWTFNRTEYAVEAGKADCN
ncbi:MAG: hypothetical protein AAGJ87_05700 [Pseudomonadota bacterium]